MNFKMQNKKMPIHKDTLKRWDSLRQRSDVAFIQKETDANGHKYSRIAIYRALTQGHGSDRLASIIDEFYDRREAVVNEKIANIVNTGE
jgi:hypothetical protein